jgi:CspA family cold shock protein
VRGVTRWFNDSKGFGFIAYEGNDNPGAFAHYTAIHTEGFKTLAEGQEVEFDLIEGPKGSQAANIKPLKS